MNSRATKNPLVRDGIAQQQRSGDALSPSYVQLDETELADFLVFAYRLSEHFAYFDRKLRSQDTWQAFFERSTPVQIARIIKTRSQDVQMHYEGALEQILKTIEADGARYKGFVESFKSLEQQLEQPATQVNQPQLEQLETQLTDIEQKWLTQLETLLTVYEQILGRFQSWFQGLDRDTPLTGMIQASIKTSLPHILRQIYQLDSEISNSRQHCSRDRHLIFQGLIQAFGLQHLLARPAARLSPQFQQRRHLSPFLQELISSEDAMKSLADGIFQPLFQSFLQIVERADDALQHSLYNNKQDVPPHLALYVAFWEILQPARKDLNTMTKRHLDFFYRQVLRLEEKSAQPDRAHVVLTLDKAQKAHKLSGDSQFSAGDDETGVERVYTLDEEIIVNQAQISQCKGLFLQLAAPAPKVTPAVISEAPKVWTLHASPQAASADGLGGEFPPLPDPSEPVLHAWLPFGDGTRPKATLGLAIADPILALSSGDRTITFSLTLNSSTVLTETGINQLKSNLSKTLQLSFSGESAWIDIAPNGEGEWIDLISKQAAGLAPSDRTISDRTIQQYQLVITAHLPVAIAPIVPYHSELPGAQIAALGVPVVKISLTQQPKAVYNFLKKTTLQDIEISVVVKGLRNLLLQNDLTVLDATKPFAPFGPQPKVGSHFYVGSQEIFQKSLSELKLSFELETEIPNDGKVATWQDHYAAYYASDKTFPPGSLSIQALQQRQWHPLLGETVSVAFLPDSESPEAPAPETPAPETSDSETPDSETEVQETQDSETQDAEASDSETQDSEAQDSEAQDSETSDSETSDSETSDSETSDSETQNPETQNSETPNPDTPNSGTEAQDFRRYTLDLTDSLNDLQLNLPSDAASADAISELTAGAVLPEPLVPLSPESQSNFLRLQLTGKDFGHTDYPIVLARQVLATAQPLTPGSSSNRQAIIGAFYKRTEEVAATDSSSNEEKAGLEGIFQADRSTVKATSVPLLPNEPYLPSIRAFSVDYSASTGRDACRLFHLYPFAGTKALLSDADIPLFPTFENEGELLIGLENLVPTTSLSLLFQLAEETANTDINRTGFKWQWHYLHNNDWRVLDDHLIVKDETKQLIRSGIVKLSIPADISNAHTTVLSSDLHWLKVSILDRSEAIPHICSIQTQAATVTFQDNKNDPSHLSAPLPPEQVVKLVEPQPEIQQIQQPYASFGGQVKEQPAHFYMRISEHLRHKGRAITIFDYERIVLERFPDIYKVRCVNHGQAIQTKGFREIAPGHITLAVIPALSHQRTLNDLEPKVNINRLAEIEEYLRSISSPWASIQVVNPQYEAIRVKFRVAMRPAYSADYAFYSRQLEQDIISHLSPWVASEGIEIHFGGEIYRSSILKFVEEHPVVDYVLDFEMYRESHDPEKSESVDLPRVSATTPHSILVSVPLSESSSGTDSETSQIQKPGHEIYEIKEIDAYRTHSHELNTLGNRVLSELTLSELSGDASDRFENILTSGE